MRSYGWMVAAYIGGLTWLAAVVLTVECWRGRSGEGSMGARRPVDPRGKTGGSTVGASSVFPRSVDRRRVPRVTASTRRRNP